MGGGVKSGFIACFLEDGGEHVRNGAFPVGACYVNRFEPAVGMSEMFVEAEGVVQIGFVGSLSFPLEHG